MSALRVMKPAGPAPKFTDDLRIAYVPGVKKIGTVSGDRYAIYCTARTIGEAIKLGTKRADINWDYEKGYMQVLSPGAAPPVPMQFAEKPAEKQSTKPAKSAVTPQKQAPKQQLAPAPVKTPEKMVAPQKAPAQAAPPSPVKRVRSLALPRVLRRAAKLAARAREQMGRQAEAAAESPPEGEAVAEQAPAAVAAEVDAMAVEAEQPEQSVEQQEEEAQKMEADSMEPVQEPATNPAGTEEQPEKQEEQAEEGGEADQAEQAEQTEEPEAKRARIEQPDVPEERGEVMESA